MERFFQITAVILAGVAAYFLWEGNADRAFASAVFASVSFFLSVRFQVKARNDQREAERLREEEEREEFENEFDEDFDEQDEPETPQLNEANARAQFAGEQRAASDEPLTTNDDRRTTNDKPKI